MLRSQAPAGDTAVHTGGAFSIHKLRTTRTTAAAMYIWPAFKGVYTYVYGRRRIYEYDMATAFGLRFPPSAIRTDGRTDAQTDGQDISCPHGPREHIFERFFSCPHGPRQHIFEGFLAVRMVLASTCLKVF